MKSLQKVQLECDTLRDMAKDLSAQLKQAETKVKTYEETYRK